MQPYRFLSMATAGLVITGVVTFFAMNEKAKIIEDDLKTRAEEKLADYADWLEVEVEGRNILLSGKAPSVDELNKVIEKADGTFFNTDKGTWGVRVVQRRKLDLLPLKKPYETSLNYKDEIVSLNGFLPSQKFKTGLFDDLAKDFQLGKLEDNTELARGANSELADNIKFALGILLNTEEGEVSLKENKFSLLATVLNEAKKEQIEKELKSELPQGLQLGSVELDVVIKEPELEAPLIAEAVKNVEEAIKNVEETIENEEQTIAENKPEDVAETIETEKDINIKKDNVVEEKQSIESDIEQEEAKVTENVEDNKEETKSPEPYVFSLIKNNNILHVSGSLPSSDIKNNLNAEAGKLGFSDIQDKTNIIEKASDGFDKVTQYALDVVSTFSEGSVLISNEKIVIDGTALNLEAYDKAKKLASAAPDGFIVESFLLDIPVVKPYIFSIDVEEETLKISGLVDQQAKREALILKAENLFPRQSIEKNIRLADGAPDDVDWQEGVEFSYLLASKLATGKITLQDKTLSVEGMAQSFKSFDALNEVTAKDLLANFEKGTINVLPPVVIPYQFKADFLEDELALSGHVPSLKTKEEVVAFSKRRFGASLKAEELIWASGAPDVYDVVLKAGLQGLSRLSEGRLVIEDMVVELSGVAAFGAPIDEIKQNFIDSLPSDYTGNADIFPGKKPEEKKPDICSATVQETITKNKIYFNVGRATILSDSFGLLDRLAETILSCPDARFEISGHTDATGSEESNLRLSKSRAQAVADYLEKAGVSSNNFEVVGYGETKAIAGNASEEEKALNRRIEFKLLKAE